MNNVRMGIEDRWAHNKDPDKRKTGSGNLTYEGFSAYSWSTVVAHKYPDKTGEGGTVVMAGDGIRNSGYTCRHKSRLRRALPPTWNVVWVDVPNTYKPGAALTTHAGLAECLAHQKANVKKLVEGMDAAKNYRSRARIYTHGLLRKIELYNDLAKYLVRKPLTLEGLKVDRAAEEANVRRANEAACIAEKSANDTSPAAEARREKRNAAKLREHANKIQKWRNGLAATCPDPLKARGDRWRSTYDDFIPLRLQKNGDDWEVQTARRVRLPVRTALYAYRASLLARAGDADKVNGRHVNGFTISGADGEGNLRVGCHRLAAAEMDLLFAKAKELEIVKPEWLEVKDEESEG